MRRLAAAVCLATLLPMPVLANGMSLGHESLPPGSSVQACLQRGVAAIAQAGLRQLSTGTIATFGEGSASDGSVTIVSIYCVPSNGIVFIAGAADRYEEVNATITSIRNYFRAPQGPGPGQGPGMMQPPPGPGGFGPPPGFSPPGFGPPPGGGLGGAPK